MAIADYQSEADEDAQAREREEIKRLLYVALTRARDRLYLSATVEGRTVPDGTRQPRRGAAARRSRRCSCRSLADTTTSLGRDADARSLADRRFAPLSGDSARNGRPATSSTVTARPSAARALRLLPAISATRTTDRSGFPLPLAADPGDPVRTAGFGVDLVGACGRRHVAPKSSRFGADFAKICRFRADFHCVGPGHFIESG